MSHGHFPCVCWNSSLFSFYLSNLTFLHDIMLGPLKNFRSFEPSETLCCPISFEKNRKISDASRYLKDVMKIFTDAGVKKQGRNMHIFVSEREEKSEFLVSIFNSCSLAQSTMIMIYHITWLRLLPLKVASDRWRGWYYFGFCVAFPIFTWSTTNTLSASRIATSWGGIIMGFAPLFNHYN